MLRFMGSQRVRHERIQEVVSALQISSCTSAGYPTWVLSLEHEELF